MSKTFKRFFAGLLTFVMVFALTAVAAPRTEVKADAEKYEMFLAVGAAQDWSMCYANEADYDGEIVATKAMVGVGETATISLAMPNEVDYTWYLAPVLVAEGVENLDYTISSITLDGAEILGEVDLNARADGDWWYEATGPYTDKQSIRLAGGYNEWGDKFMATSPVGWTEISYTITLNKIEKAPEYEMFVAIGAAQDWSMCYANEAGYNGEIIATKAMASEGKTVTIGVTMPSEVDYTWYVAPVLVAEGIEKLDYTIDSITLDGAEILGEVDLNVREEGNWWYEGTGEFTDKQSIRLAGGYNEWGDKFMATSPVGWTELFYTITINDIEKAPEYETFLAVGAGNDWSMCFANEADNASGIVATVEKVSVGETVTVSLTMPNEVDYTWYLAPVLVAEGVQQLDYTVNSITIDGAEVLDSVNLDAREEGNWWYEGTGPYTETQAIRLAGGYNEWGDKFMAESPVGYTEVSYTYTLNSIGTEASTASNEIIYDGEFNMFLAGTAESADQAWDWTFANGSTDNAALVGTVANAKAGDTVTIDVTYPGAVYHTWWLAPTLVLPEEEDGVDKYLVDYTIDKVTIDGTDVTDKIDLSLKEQKSWYEGTEDHPVTRTIRLAGGYNEWGEHFISGDLLAGHTNIEYTITINKVYGVVVEEVEGPKADLDGSYNAYFGIQSDAWSFRNPWDDATYGKDTNPEAFGQMSLIETGTNAIIKKSGTFTDAVIAGNGTYSVELNDIAWDEGTTALNQLFISTDIPNSGEITFSNIRVDFDGKNVMEFAEGFVDPDYEEVIRILFINIWNKDLTNAYNMAGMLPNSNVKITFDVAGFNYDKAAEAEPSQDPIEAPVAPTEAPVAPTEAPAAPTEAPAAPTEAPATSTVAPAEVETNGMSAAVIVIIVVVVIAIAAGAVFVVMKKKKQS